MKAADTGHVIFKSFIINEVSSSIFGALIAKPQERDNYIKNKTEWECYRRPNDKVTRNMYIHYCFKPRHFILGDSTADLTPEILLPVISGNQD